jgi:ankyrin repeat protein
MAKTKNKRRVKIKIGCLNIEECAPTFDKENYVEFLADLYEKPPDPNTAKNLRKHPGDEYTAYLDELKETAKQARPSTITKPPPVKRPEWKGSGINLVKRDNKPEPKDPSSVDYLQYKLKIESARFSQVTESKLDRSKQKEDFTMSGQLFKAVADGRFLHVKTLLKCGVKISSKNQDGHGVLVTTLHIEDAEQRESMFRYLLKKDADCMVVDEQTGRSVLAWACCLNRVEQVAKILQICQGDIDFSQKDKSGKTVLHHAVISGNTPVVKMLVTTMNKYGLSVDIVDELGLTPFLYSKKLGYSEIGDVLHLEGRASTKQFDNKLYRSGTVWFEECQKERQKENAQLKRVEKEWYKMNGKVSLLERVESQGLPTVKLGGMTRSQECVAFRHSRISDQASDSGISSKDMSARSAPSRTLDPPGAVTRSQPNLQVKPCHSRNSISVNSSVTNSMNATTSQSTLCTHSSVSNSVNSLHSNGPQQGIRESVYRPPVSGGYEPAFALLAQVDEGSRVGNFVGSVAMPALNPTQGNAVGNTHHMKQSTHPSDSSSDRGMHTMFTVLSEQKSRAFRASVIKQQRPKTPEPEPVKPKKQRKTGVSSLAIIMGKDTRDGRFSRRKRSAKGKSPAAKSSPVNGPSRKISKATRSSPGVKVKR